MLFELRVVNCTCFGVDSSQSNRRFKLERTIFIFNIKFLHFIQGLLGKFFKAAQRLFQAWSTFIFLVEFEKLTLVPSLRGILIYRLSGRSCTLLHPLLVLLHTCDIPDTWYNSVWLDLWSQIVGHMVLWQPWSLVLVLPPLLLHHLCSHPANTTIVSERMSMPRLSTSGFSSSWFFTELRCGCEIRIDGKPSFRNTLYWVWFLFEKAASHDKIELGPHYVVCCSSIGVLCMRTQQLQANGQ